MSKIKIALDVSTDNEGTDAPWWVIVDPRQNMGCNIDLAASCIRGPYFSREEADWYFKAASHHFSKRACVYCMSGYFTEQYKQAYRKAEKRGWNARNKPWYIRARRWLTSLLPLLLVAVPIRAHLGPDEGLHHFLGQLCGLWPFAVAVAGMVWAKLWCPFTEKTEPPSPRPREGGRAGEPDRGGNEMENEIDLCHAAAIASDAHSRAFVARSRTFDARSRAYDACSRADAAYTRAYAAHSRADAAYYRALAACPDRKIPLRNIRAAPKEKI